MIRKLFFLFLPLLVLITVSAGYSGYEKLTFSLATAPSGMTVEQSGHSADMIWQQPVLPADGARMAELTFDVTVSQGTPLQTQTNSKIITITDHSTNLEGVSIELVSDNFAPDGFKFYKIDSSTVSEIPVALKANTDIFYLESSYQEFGDIVVRLPMNQLFPGTSWRTHLVDMVWWDEEGGVHGSPEWSPGPGRTFRVVPDGTAIFEFSAPALEGLMYFHLFERGVPLTNARDNNTPGQSLADLASWASIFSVAG